MVKFYFPYPISNITGDHATNIFTTSLYEALNKLSDIYGDNFKKYVFDENGEINRYLQFYLKGYPINQVDLMKKKLNDNDEIVILIIIGGG
jgi:molybdopterin converting factor small subunit